MAAKGSPKLTQRNGKRLAGGKPVPKGDFALPGGGPGGADAYPVDTPGRARDALARGSANASPADQAKIKAKVKSKYPSITVAGTPKAAARSKSSGKTRKKG